MRKRILYYGGAVQHLLSELTQLKGEITNSKGKEKENMMEAILQVWKATKRKTKHNMY